MAGTEKIVTKPGRVVALNSVSETALINLRARAIESQKKNPVLKDYMGVECLNRLRRLMPQETASFTFGIRDAREIETYGNNIRVVEEWSYFEDPDIVPQYFRLFCNFKPLSRSQWTVRAIIG